MAMLLPTAFAACTSDEFEVLDNGNALANRKEIGKVTLSFDNGAADTRWDASFLPEVNDVFGAALADVFVGDKKGKPEDKWKDNYTLTDYIQTNYPYTTKDKATWSSEANLVEGNYVFYAPYGQSHQVRSAIKFETPVAQKLEVKDGAIVENSALENVAADAKSPFYIGYKFFDASESNMNISIKMRSLFAYPKFTFKNATGNPVTINRILVKSANSDIVASGELNNKEIVKALRAEKAGDWGGALADNMKGNQYTANLISKAENTNLLRADLSEKITVADSKEISFQLVMPAQKFDAGKLEVYFVTESGKAYVWKNSTSQITTVPGRRFPAEDYDLNGQLKTAAGQLLTMTAGKNESLADAPYIVTSKAELISVISATPASVDALELTVVGEVEFDEAVRKAIAEKVSQTVSFTGNLNIIGGTEAAPLNIDQKVVFDQAVVKSGVVKFNNDKATFNGIVVEKGAALSVDKVASEGTKNVTNNGTLALNAKVGAVENNGELTLGAKGGYTSLASANEAAPKVNITGAVEFEGTELVGEWNVPAGATLTLKNAATLPYGSELTVAGRLEGAKLTVKGELTVSGRCGANVEVAGTYVENETETNKTKEAIVNCEATSLFTGEISADDADDKKANIVNVEKGAGFMANSAAIANTTAIYTVENVTEVVTIPAQCNTLVVTGNVTAGETTLTLGSTDLEKVTVEGDVVAINEAVTINNATTVIVEGDIMSTKNVTFTAATDLTVKGELNTTATVAAASATKVVLGKVVLNAETASLILTTAADVTINGEVIAKNDITLAAAAKLTLKGDVTLAEGKAITVTPASEISIVGNVTMQGTGTTGATFTCSAASTIKVYGGHKLTIGDKMTVKGASSNLLTFDSSKYVTPEAEVAAGTPGTKDGLVVNNGKVQWAAKKYQGDDKTATDTYKAWWSGNAADDDATDD